MERPMLMQLKTQKYTELNAARSTSQTAMSLPYFVVHHRLYFTNIISIRTLTKVFLFLTCFEKNLKKICKNAVYL